MTIISHESQEVLVDGIKASSLENLTLSIEHALLSNDIEPQRIFFLKVPETFKKFLYSKDWYWNGRKLVVYKDDF
ncbi:MULTISPECIES: hypothetical protein [Helicobacter]|uniref:Uncharacterized protein n=1 Tax=Helicobacter ibis TaxID=2962633 RepID=A0ABT4VG93_9HELI|nr:MULTISPECIES: hypothetical protein [Helicobacter]MDA3967049.1 hypothetical protein [Helicobacter sp. WB40]MDA3969183.1 hypothetical protein [Helicobacter ibis]